MALQIWKFSLGTLTEKIDVEMPLGAEVIHVGQDANGELCLWARVATNNGPVMRRFYIFGTGQDMPSMMRHLGTVVMGTFVWHVYEFERD